MEDKLGYIKLIQALSLLTKCPMKYYQAMTSLIEGALITHYRRNNLCAPYFAGGHQKGFEAAYVKEPHKGMHEWVVDLDITSSYPTAIITLNMSNETYFGRIIDIPEHQVVNFVRKRKFPSFHLSREKEGVKLIRGDHLEKFNMALEKGLFAIAPCGSIFKTKPTGVIAEVEKNIFFKRKEVKGKMFKEEKGSDRRKELFSLQWAIKILLNAMFGITSVPYSRYFNTNLSEAITSCGRHTIKMGEKFVNDLLNNPQNSKKLIDFINRYGGKHTNGSYIQNNK
jgi:DNA polymerase elongation subunit (family B)